MVLLSGTASDIVPDQLAAEIDRHIQARLDHEGVVAAERSSDVEFLRRLSLDLIGRIPTPEEIREFHDDPGADKRSRWIDRLLSSPEHARHFARVWRSLLLPETETERQLRYFEPGFEAWLIQLRQDSAGFDQLVRELLTVPIAPPDATPSPVLIDLRRPNPAAFLAVKRAEPGTIASTATRLFLGLSLECAQCHDHPHDTWSQKQFWNQAAFFAGIERRGRGPFAPLVETASRRSIPMPESGEEIPAEFLDHSPMQLDESTTARHELTRWITDPRNPFFARAIVNRVWSQLFGRGLVEPVDDMSAAHPASHPELLSELAESFAASGFDLTLLYRALCRTEAYQRTSRQTDPSQVHEELLARMPIKRMSGDQLFDSLALAIGYESKIERNPGEPERDPVRSAVMRHFAGNAGGQPHTSVAQALAMMNGRVISDATRPESGERLRRVAAEYPDDVRGQIETLYLCTLSRRPNSDELDRLLEYHRAASSTDPLAPLGDILWMLLNSAEFGWNH